jgi:HNH endonuclease
VVVIRALQPVVEIRMPTRTSAKSYRPSRAAAAVRRAVDFPSPTPQPTPCRLWQGPVDDHGYGTMWRLIVSENGARTRTKTRPHRWVVEQVLGRRLKRREVVMHLCDNRLCFRYDHLRVGTARDNNRDMMAKGRYVHAGGRPKRPKLTGSQINAIRRRYLSGLYPESIAEELGLSLAEVRKHTSGLNAAWRWHRSR